MCGIVGIYYFDQSRKVDQHTLRKAVRSLRHRGPDDEGVWCSDGVGLGFRRLSIIDLSSSGNQPMPDASGLLHIIFNGEVYNYRELRPSLEAQGGRFRTKTDTEVVLQSYVQHGDLCVRQFNGMWGFAIYDQKKKSLFCSRDRFGVKPFYYFTDSEKFVFASEVKTLLAMGIPRRENKKKVFEYVAYGYLDTNQETLFEGVRQIKPGNSLTVTPDGIQEKSYWSLADVDNENFDSSMQAKANELRDIFFDAVRLRLRSDVPVGVLLSGGIDSSAIVCTIDALHKNSSVWEGGDVRVFSAVYDDPLVDESEYIDAVIRAKQINCTKIRPQSSDIVRDIEKVVYHQDEPCASMTVFSHWYLMREIHAQGIKVILSGQGADESLGGYLPLVVGYHLRDIAGRLAFRELAAEIRSLQDIHGFSRKTLLIQAVKAMSPRTFGAFAKSALQEEGLRHIPLNVWRQNISSYGYNSKYRRHSHLNEHHYRFLTRDTIPRILHYEDRNSMAFSIEQRVPFLDYRLVELLFRLPNSFKIKRGVTKRILREALKDILPAEIYRRTSKIGFRTPEDQWLKSGLKTYAMDLFNSSAFTNRWYLSGSAATKTASDFLDGKKKTSAPIWRWLNMEVWYKSVLDDSTGLARGNIE